MKTLEEALEEVVSAASEPGELWKAVKSIQKDAFDAGWVAGINEAAAMCGGDSHIEEGVLSLLTQPKDTPCSKKGEM